MQDITLRLYRVRTYRLEGSRKLLDRSFKVVGTDSLEVMIAAEREFPAAFEVSVRPAGFFTYSTF